MKGVFDALLTVGVFWASGFLGKASYSILGSPFVYWLIVMAGVGFWGGNFLRIGIKAIKDANFLLAVRAVVFVLSFCVLVNLLTGVLRLDYPTSNVRCSDAGVLIGYFGILLVLGFSPLFFAKKNLKTVARLAKLNSR